MRFETNCVQGGYNPDNNEPRVVPICQSTAYKYTSNDFMTGMFDVKEFGNLYTRINNPTWSAVEEKIALLEGGVAALLTSSGQAATMIAITNICNAGDHVVSSSKVYGGTVNLFDVTLKKLGIETTFIDPDAPSEEIQKAVKDNTKLIFGETLANASLAILDIEKMAKIAHDNKIPLIVDNTFPTPYLCRPFEFGADIVIHSTSKYMDGHAVTLGGVIVDSGNFDWSSGKFPELVEPDESYHGVIYTETFGKAAYVIKARYQKMRDMGASISPFNAFLLNLGLETLSLRMERHCSNALAVAEYLEKSPYVNWVNYPALKSSKYYELLQKQMPLGGSGVISFGIKGGESAPADFMENIKIGSMSIHVADARTCVLHPASTTHRQLSGEMLHKCGITEDLIRYSVGIENIDDILEDLENSLKLAAK